MFLAQVLILLTAMKPSDSDSETGTLVMCKSQQRTSLKDSVTSSWLIAQHQIINGRPITCSSLCVQEKRCVSFLYNDVTKDCRLLAVVKELTDISSPGTAIGYRYYDTCRAQGYYGASCSADDDCRLPNIRCFQSRCRCLPGYSFGPTLAACVTHCTSYGPEFETIPDHFIEGNNDETVNGLDAAGCLDRCRLTTSFICRTADVRVHPDPACSLSSVTKMDVADSKWYYYTVWEVVHYQRHCSL